MRFPSIRAFSSWRSNIRGLDNSKLTGKRDPAWWFTGTLPQFTPGFDGQYLRSLPLPCLEKQTSQSAMAYFDNGWTLYEVLFASLKGEEAFFIPPAHGLRHPMQFYYGHTAVLYVNKLFVAGLLPNTIDREFEKQFEVGVDEMRWDDDLSFSKAWPSVSEVRDYRAQVYQLVKQVVHREFATEKAVTWDSPLWSFFMGCEHDRIHLETSSVLIRELPLSLVQKPDYFPPAYSSTPSTSVPPSENALVAISGRPVRLGKDRHFPTYGWDNEYGFRTEVVKDFKTTRYLVSNQEFLAFVKDKGYLKEELWTKEGWMWRRFRNTLLPHFWVNPGPASNLQDMQLRRLFDVVPMEWSFPVICNIHEARAFAKWKKQRLPTESELQLLLDHDHQSEHVVAGKNDNDTNASLYNFNLQYGSETPVHFKPSNQVGIHDAMGNVWCWTEDLMMPLNGFEPHDYYLDFTEPCFDGKHHVIRGGSFISTGDNGTSPFSRFHFRAHFHQMAGFRLVQQVTEKKNVYETDASVDQYLHLHYNNILPQELMFASRFPQRCADLVSKYAQHKERVLDVGCAVGASTFELSSEFQHVVGVDFSYAFIDCAKTLQREGRVLDSTQQVFCTSPNSMRDRVEFHRGDACALDVHALGGRFDAILAANLLCRLPDPLVFLHSLPSLLKDKGIVVLVSPYSWLEEYTPSSKWMGEIGNSEASLLATMKALNFELMHESTLPLAIKDHARKYQYIASHACVFQYNNRTIKET